MAKPPIFLISAIFSQLAEEVDPRWFGNGNDTMLIALGTIFTIDDNHILHQFHPFNTDLVLKQQIKPPTVTKRPVMQIIDIIFSENCLHLFLLLKCIHGIIK